MSKHELTEADLKRLIENPLIPESIKDTYREKLKELEEKKSCSICSVDK